MSATQQLKIRPSAQSSLRGSAIAATAALALAAGCMPYTQNIPNDTRPQRTSTAQPPLPTGSETLPESGDDTSLPTPALFVSHAFTAENIPGARPINVIYQNVLTTAYIGRASGSLRSMTLDVDITIEPGALYQISLDVNRRDYAAIITSPPGRYARGQSLTTNATEAVALNGESARIESATLNEPALRNVVRKMRAKNTARERPLLALDWESAWLDRILDPAHPGHVAAVREGARALDVAREEWPEAAISFYACPWGTRSPSEQWYETMAATLAPILDRVDWLAPSIYDKIKDSDASERAVDRIGRSHESSLRLACRVANGRPILVWVTNRYRQPGAAYHTHLIEQDEFVNHLRWAWNLTEQGERIDGFVWWYPEREAFASQNNYRTDSVRDANTLHSEMDEIERRYGRAILDTLKLPR